MMENNLPYKDLEAACMIAFNERSDYYHFCSPENHPIIFQGPDEFRQGLCLLAMCVKKQSDVTVITFQIMNNHLHILFQGKKEQIMELVRLYLRILDRVLKKMWRNLDLSADECRYIPITDLDNIRNVIGYINRNGFLVNPNYTPFTYPWGGNIPYFNHRYVELSREYGRPLGARKKREISHSHLFDNVKGLYTIEGNVCPNTFCDIKFGESMFRNAHHYMSVITRNLENMTSISKIIGEQIFYTDDDLFMYVASTSKKKFDCTPSQLNALAKVELARKLHFDFNASNKQIQRLLKLSPNEINTILPPKY